MKTGIKGEKAGLVFVYVYVLYIVLILDWKAEEDEGSLQTT